MDLRIALLLVVCFSELCRVAESSSSKEKASPTDSATVSATSDQSSGNEEPLTSSEEDKNEDVTVTSDEKNDDDEHQNDEKKGEYGAGSLCMYCKYCKFCKLCDKDCPCKTSKKRPNCHLCKYCSYCPLCTSVCESFCQPGSFLDTISSAIYSALPKFDSKMKEEVNKDIESAKDWIKSYL